jgi:hypothetical protein
MIEVTWNVNTEKSGVEIRFSERPDADVLTQLKANGWRWSRYSGCWYQRDSESARQFAQDFAGAASIVAPAPASSRRRYGSTYTRFSSGAEVYTNRNGRCEDAPCCGCCS